MIGEDTSSHVVNLIWIWDFKTGKMTRVASVPMGSETTSPYWYTIGDWQYMTLVAQHPYGAGTVKQGEDGGAHSAYTTLESNADSTGLQRVASCTLPLLDRDFGLVFLTGHKAWIGYVGPIPVYKNVTAGDEGACPACHMRGPRTRELKSSTFLFAESSIIRPRDLRGRTQLLVLLSSP